MAAPSSFYACSCTILYSTANCAPKPPVRRLGTSECLRIHDSPPSSFGKLGADVSASHALVQRVFVRVGPIYARLRAKGIPRCASCPLTAAVGGSRFQSQATTSWPCLIPLRVGSMMLRSSDDSSRCCFTVQGGVPLGQREDSRSAICAARLAACVVRRPHVW